MRRERDREIKKKEGKKKLKVMDEKQNPRQRGTAALLVELCGFFGQALQHAKMLTLSQNNPDHYHLNALKFFTMSTYKTNHTYPNLGKEAKWGWGIKEGRKTG